MLLFLLPVLLITCVAETLLYYTRYSMLSPLPKRLLGMYCSRYFSIYIAADCLATPLFAVRTTFRRMPRCFIGLFLHVPFCIAITLISRRFLYCAALVDIVSVSSGAAPAEQAPCWRAVLLGDCVVLPFCFPYPPSPKTALGRDFLCMPCAFSLLLPLLLSFSSPSFAWAFSTVLHGQFCILVVRVVYRLYWG